MPKILNKIGKCDNWTFQCKTPQTNAKEYMQNKSVDTLLQKASRTILSLMLGHPTKYVVADNEILDKLDAILCIKVILSLMLGHPMKCVVADNEILDKLAAILCIKVINTYKQPTYSLSCTHAEIKQLGDIKLYIYYLKRGHL